MHCLTIHHLGPIVDCTIDLKNYTILTGSQATGKSTIAKTVFYFRTLKDDIYNLLIRRNFVAANSSVTKTTLFSDFVNASREKFLSTFGSSYGMDPEMSLTYRYSDTLSVKVHLVENNTGFAPNYVRLEFDKPLSNFLKQNNNFVADTAEELARIRETLALLFDDKYEIVYVPAGRSLLTLLGSQFSLFYATMDDTQKRLVDACTRDYIERVMRIKPQLADGIDGLTVNPPFSNQFFNELKYGAKLIRQILKGDYIYVDGEERIQISNGRYVKINFASSGQQESLWILNLLYYYYAQNKPVYFIIEEPESHLFPESQKIITEFISLVANHDNGILLTTHSPYVLGSVNNLLYAHEVGLQAELQVNSVLRKSLWLDYEKCATFFVEGGSINDGLDEDTHQIDSDRIDAISDVINDEFSKIVEIEQNRKN